MPLIPQLLRHYFVGRSFGFETQRDYTRCPVLRHVQGALRLRLKPTKKLLCWPPGAPGVLSASHRRRLLQGPPSGTATGGAPAAGPAPPPKAAGPPSGPPSSPSPPASPGGPPSSPAAPPGSPAPAGGATAAAEAIASAVAAGDTKAAASAIAEVGCGVQLPGASAASGHAGLGRSMPAQDGGQALVRGYAICCWRAPWRSSAGVRGGWTLNAAALRFVQAAASGQTQAIAQATAIAAAAGQGQALAQARHQGGTAWWCAV